MLVDPGHHLRMTRADAGTWGPSYRVHCGRQLTSLQKAFGAFAIKDDQTKDHSMILAEALAPVIDGPAPTGLLLAEADCALDIRDSGNGPGQNVVSRQRRSGDLARVCKRVRRGNTDHAYP